MTEPSSGTHQITLFAVLAVAIPALILGFGICLALRHAGIAALQAGKSDPALFLESIPDDILENPSFDSLFNYGFSLYSQKRFRESILANYAALAFDTQSVKAWSNICAAYNMLDWPHKAVVACSRALEIDPNFALAKNNRQWAYSMIADAPAHSK